MDSKDIILDVENLNTSFISDRKEVRIVKGVSFQLKRGSALAAARYEKFRRMGAVQPERPGETARKEEP